MKDDAVVAKEQHCSLNYERVGGHFVDGLEVQTNVKQSLLQGGLDGRRWSKRHNKEFIAGMGHVVWNSYSLDSDGLRLGVGLDPYFESRPALECLVIRETQEPNLVQRVAGIADQLPQEDIPIGVQAVHDHVHQTIHLQTAGTH